MDGSGIYRATVVSVGSYTVSLKIPRLTFEYIYTDVPFYGNKPSVNDEIIVGFLHGEAGNPVAIIPGGASAPSSSAQGDIDGVTAGLGLSGGGTSGTVSLAFDPSELSSVTVATDDKVVIADTSDSDNPKHVTVSSIAALATASPAGSDTQVQFNNNNSFGASSNMVFDGTNLDIAGLKIGGTAVTSTAAELNILDGVTSTTAELNILDGVTSTAAELNILDGVTSTTAELNILDGVTATATEINYLDNDDLTAADLTKLAAITSTAAELNILDGVVATAAEVNTVADVTLGTVTASKAVTVDANKDVASFRNVTLTGELDAATLDISGNATITNSTGNYVLIGGNANEQIKLVSDNNSGRPYISFWNQDASGNLDRKGYIGYPHANSNTSSLYIRCDQGTLDLGAKILLPSTASYVLWPATLPTVTSYSTLRRGTYSGTGNVVGYDGSSIRYKENVTNFVKSDWEKIYNLQAVRFTWKEEVAADKHASWGLISEDVHAEIPELGVMRVVDGVNDGNPVPDTVNYEQMCVFLLEAIKDLNARLAALE